MPYRECVYIYFIVCLIATKLQKLMLKTRVMLQSGMKRTKLIYLSITNVLVGFVAQNVHVCLSRVLNSVVLPFCVCGFFKLSEFVSLRCFQLQV